MIAFLMCLSLILGGPVWAFNPVDDFCNDDQKRVVTETEEGDPVVWCSVNDKKNGPSVSYFLSGQMKVWAEFKDDILHGKYRAWHSNGKLSKEGFYSNGKLDQEWTRWREDGSIIDEGAWEKGVPDGKWKFYHANGELSEAGEMSAGKKICTWRSWDAEGNEVGTVVATKDPECSRFKLFSGSANLLTAFQNEGGKSYFWQFNWTPSYHWYSNLKLRGNLGFSTLNDSSGGNFLLIEYALLFHWTPPKIHPYAIEIGGGLQTWTGYKTKPITSLNFVWNWEKKLFWLIDRVFIGHSAFLDERTTHEIKLGAGASF